MILVDWQIEELCKNEAMVEPFDPGLLNPTSLDIRLGQEIIVFRKPIGMPFWLCDFLTKKGILKPKKINISVKPFWAKSRDFVLACSLETFNLPDNIGAQFALKSSRAREGWEHCLAGWCDPGWNGSKLTLELSSVNPMKSLPLTQGLKIGQMKFFKTDELPNESYRIKGHYNNDKTVQPSKMDRTYPINLSQTRRHS